MTNETLAALISRTADRPQSDCATVETIHAWVTGQLATAQAEHVKVHVEQCSFCAAEARLAGWFEGPASSPAVDQLAAHLADGARARQAAPAAGARPAAANGWSARWLSAGLAAAATVILVIGVYSAMPPAVPELSGGQVFRGGDAYVVEPRGDVAVAPERVVWEGGMAASYQVNFLAVDGEVVWSTTASGPVAVPASAQQRLDRGVAYRVRITPIGDAGETLGQATESDFRIARTQIE